MNDEHDEFRILADDVTDPRALTMIAGARRETRTTSEGSVSALVWGADPNVVFLHGAALNAHTWDSTILELGMTALAIDLPGHGNSSWWDDFGYTPERLAATVAEYEDALPLQGSQILVGHSLGGMVSVELAARRPEGVTALVLVDVTPGITAQDAAPLFAFLGGPLVFDSRDQIVEAALAAGIGNDRTKLRRGVIYNTVARADGKVVFKHHLASPPPGRSLPIEFASLWAPLEQLDVPIVLVRGTQGFLSDSLVEEFKRRVPLARVVDVDAGHNVHEQNSEALAQIIRSVQ